MRRFLPLLAASLMACAAPALAQGGRPPGGGMGTPEDQRACQPDAVKLCRHTLEQNDPMVTLGCFKLKARQLSPACRAVLQNYGQL